MALKSLVLFWPILPTIAKLSALDIDLFPRAETSRYYFRLDCNLARFHSPGPIWRGGLLYAGHVHKQEALINEPVMRKKSWAVNHAETWLDHAGRVAPLVSNWVDYKFQQAKNSFQRKEFESWGHASYKAREIMQRAAERAKQKIKRRNTCVF